MPKDMKLIMEEWRPYLSELIKFKRPKRKKSPKGDFFGTEDRPCSAVTQREDDDLGDEMFHAYDPKRKSEDWECNTEIEDKLQYALQSYIGHNSKKALQGRVSEFIIDYFKNKDDGSLPLSRYTKDKTLWRGAGRGFDEAGIKFLNSIDLGNPIGEETSDGLSKYAFKKEIGLRNRVIGWSDNIAIPMQFLDMNKQDMPIAVMFELPARTTTKNGGFFIDLDKFYELKDNPAQKVHGAIEKEFFDVHSYKREEEILLIPAGDGDAIKPPFIYLHTKNLRDKLQKLAKTDQELYSKLRGMLGYSERELKNAKGIVLRDRARLKNFIIKPFEKLIKEFDPTNPNVSLEKANTLLGRVGPRINVYNRAPELYMKAIGEEEFKEFIMSMMSTKDQIEKFVDDMANSGDTLQESKIIRLKVIK